MGTCQESLPGHPRAAPEERAAYLAAAAADDPELQREVESLLAADGGSVPTGRLPLMGRDEPAGAFLPAGEHIGPYEVLAPIGAGGMGEVYRARDGKLHRDVALKVLPAAFASDPDRMARFKREAQVLAALNHPHIGGIYGLEESATGRRWCWSWWTGARSPTGSALAGCRWGKRWRSPARSSRRWQRRTRSRSFTGT